MVCEPLGLPKTPLNPAAVLISGTVALTSTGLSWGLWWLKKFVAALSRLPIKVGLTAVLAGDPFACSSGEPTPSVCRRLSARLFAYPASKFNATATQYPARPASLLVPNEYFIVPVAGYGTLRTRDL